ncbi:hypothetical protein F0P96_03765 [Hymenobacter busanensis]|uniref:Uncharacterized protein n=1 Tax=Hymenobacter busanensis TaxID=2607656 RepID=A0A7L4ZWB9_9BACT|nr:hypothetical protein [Hymenobacter busanensis]KAA9339744.1 hypothetical protein F0P96_03765 [Hymenobacter busanensis]QHJ06502.1 hypothetical protein GUY19_03985 [Hymenobacter busanensis]
MLHFFKRLWGSGAPVAWKPLQRSASELRAYARWVHARTYLNWLGPYFKAYHYAKAGLPTAHGNLRAQLLQECSHRGAVLLYDPQIGPENFRHLFDLIRDRVQALGYHLASSDLRIRQHPRYTEAIAKHFLKPLPTDCPETGRCQQRFGTIAVDLVTLNGLPGFIRVMANVIDDGMFCPAFSFDELMEAVFNVQEEPRTSQA